MEFLGTVVQSIACLLATMAACILLWLNKEKSHSKNMLACLLLVLAVLNLNGVLYHTRWYLQVPQLHKVAIPFSLLISPAAFLYIRSVLASELRFKKYDWALLLPAFLFAINLIPYYTLPIEVKRVYIESYYQQSSLRTSDTEGLLPAYVFGFFRVCWSLFFIILNYRLLRLFKKNASEKLMQDNAALLRWLYLLNSLLALLVAAALLAAIMAPIFKTVFNLLDWALGLTVLLMAIQLFRRPAILYGIFQPSAADFSKEPVAPKQTDTGISEVDLPAADEIAAIISISPERASRIKKSMDQLFQEKEAFLNPNYSLDQMATDLNIPRHVTSAFINQEYGMGFREYLNRSRVQYMLTHWDKPEWEHFTLEAISAECGFNSRITFLKNFKKFTGQTPSEFSKNR